MIKIKATKQEAVQKFSKKEWQKFDTEIGFGSRPEPFYFAAYQGAKIVGYIKMEIWGGIAYLNEIIVAKNYRGKGLGRKLLQTFENKGRKAGVRKFVLRVPEVNKKAIKFYTKTGYANEATVPNHYFGYDWYNMAKKA